MRKVHLEKEKQRTVVKWAFDLCELYHQEIVLQAQLIELTLRGEKS